jgi:acyl-CoA thioester hydrolase
VVVKVAASFKQPARYDEELLLTTKLTRHTHVRFDHAYELKRGDTVLCEGTSTIACVGRDGQLRQMPEGFEPR